MSLYPSEQIVLAQPIYFWDTSLGGCPWGMGIKMVQRLPTRVISTGLVGPNSLFREGLRRVLNSPYEAKAVAETIESVQKIVELDLIVLISGADQNNMLDQVRFAKEENANARIVVISDTDNSEVVWQLLVAGADAYLLRKISLEALLSSLEVVMLGGTVVLPTQRNTFAIERADSVTHNKVSAEVDIPKLGADLEYKKLSDREIEVLVCLTKGDSNKQIAKKFAIAEATVKVHLKAILRKIRVRNRTQAAVWAQHNYVACPIRLPQGPLQTPVTQASERACELTA